MGQMATRAIDGINGTSHESKHVAEMGSSGSSSP